MTKTTMLIALLLGSPTAQAQDITVFTWGGAIEASQVDAYNKPFNAETGIGVQTVAAEDPAVALRTQVAAGNVTGDVFDVSMSDAIRLCDEGALMTVDLADLPRGADGTPAANDFIDGALQECGVGSIVAGTVIAYDSTKFLDGPPKTVADFFDIETYPGKRALAKSVKRTLYLALIADGVAPSGVYEQLATSEGVDRAFAKLDTIKNDVIWWEAGAQPPQLLADGEVAMATSYNGRIFDAMINEGKPFEIIWQGQYLELNAFVVPNGAPHPKDALAYLAFATGPQPLADQAKYISYGPARKSSAALLGVYKDGKTKIAPYLPTHAKNIAEAVMDDPEFWADREAELSERFNAWLVGR